VRALQPPSVRPASRTARCAVAARCATILASTLALAAAAMPPATLALTAATFALTAATFALAAGGRELTPLSRGAASLAATCLAAASAALYTAIHAAISATCGAAIAPPEPSALSTTGHAAIYSSKWTSSAVFSSALLCSVYSLSHSPLPVSAAFIATLTALALSKNHQPTDQLL
jgi:hypothetical protein